MRLVSLAKREGQTIVEAFGAAYHGRAVLVDLLFVRRAVTNKTLVLRNPASKQRIKVRLPDAALNLKADGYAKNLTLEVINDEE